MFTENVIEIDLYTNLRKQRFIVPTKYTDLEELYIYIPPPVGFSVALPLRFTNQRIGQRAWFLCRYCDRRVQRLYVHPFHRNDKHFPIACRRCHQLKYDSQYKKDILSKRWRLIQKMEKYRSQKRRLGYGSYPTQFGMRYRKYYQEYEALEPALIAEQRAQTARFNNQLAKIKAGLFA